MSTHVLLNLSNEFRKRDTMRDLPSILSFSQRAYKFNNTGFYILYDIKITLKSYFRRENVLVL